MQEQNKIAIILVVSERSGSNLLRTLLGNHSQISAPVAPHLIVEFYSDRKYYGDLKDQNNSNKLINDMLQLCNHEFHDWKLDIENGSEEFPKSLIECFDFMYSTYSKSQNKNHYCSKGIGAFRFLDQLRAELPGLKFVHLVRDPRDHVASWMKKPVNLLTPYDAIWKWKEEQSMLIDAMQSKNFPGISVRYEDLIDDPKSVMSGIFDYLEIPIEEACFSTDSKNSESERNSLWNNLSQPIISDNSKKYMKVLSKEDVNLIETIAGNEMKFFGYEITSNRDWKMSEEFVKTTVEQRIKKKAEIEKSERPELKALHSKWDMRQEIRLKRRKEWKLSRLAEPKKIKIENVQNNFLKTRLKYLSYALIGSGLSRKLKKRGND